MNQLGLMAIWSLSVLAAWFTLNSIGMARGPRPCGLSIKATGPRGPTGLEKREFSKAEPARHVSRKCGCGLLCGSV